MRALFLLLIPCLIPGVFADDWDDFTNNLATDLVISQHIRIIELY